MYKELKKLLLRFHDAKKVYNYWNKCKYNKLKTAVSLKIYKLLLKKIKFFF